MRTEVQQFAEMMNQRLEENSHKDKIGWSDWEINDLILKIQRNIRDIYMENPEKEIVNHAVDIANYAMMIADNYRENES